MSCNNIAFSFSFAIPTTHLSYTFCNDHMYNILGTNQGVCPCNLGTVDWIFQTSPGYVPVEASNYHVNTCYVARSKSAHLHIKPLNRHRVKRSHEIRKELIKTNTCALYCWCAVVYTCKCFMRNFHRVVINPTNTITHAIAGIQMHSFQIEWWVIVLPSLW